MKKIINGKKYDTETAREVCMWENTEYYSDYNHRRETLYVKKTGEYFLHAPQGIRVKYSFYDHDGQAIIPLKHEWAQEWAQDRLTGDEYEKIFGEVSE